MKVLTTILSIIGALATIGGIIFVIVKYGKNILAWFKELFAKMGIGISEDIQIYEDEEAPAEDAPEGSVQAEETDFE